MLKNIGVGEYLCTICGCMNSHTKECSCQHDGGYMSDCKCTTKNKLSLYDQLNYINERGFYSVIVNKEGKFIIASTKAPIRRLWFTGSCDTVEQAKEQLGLSYALSDEQVNDKDWQIVDTIHPSELMGKGFQVGDKVKYKGVEMVIEGAMYIGSQPYYFCEGQKTRFSPLELKPVLPVEEEKITITYGSHCCGCDIWDCESRSDGSKWFFPKRGNGWIHLLPNIEYAVCNKCMGKICEDDVNKAILLLQSKGIIKDGKIVNL